jgi:Leucine-rich repeat (LRR) protein
MKQRIKTLLREGLIREELSDDEMNNLKRLVDSGDEGNIEMAFMIASGHGEDVENALFTYWYNNIKGKNLTWDELKNTKELHLNDNKLTNLPESIGNLPNLKSLILFRNKLTNLPESIGNLTNLESLYLYRNKLTSLPESIGKLTNLVRLDLVLNKLEEVPESIGNLTNLTYLNLSRNGLTSLPESIGKLTNLVRLDLFGNPISDEEKERIKKLLPNTNILF